MAADKGRAAVVLEDCQEYLLLLARAHLDARLRGKIGASDIVQETMLHAWKGWDQFNGTSDGERLAWLRSTLLHVLLDKVKEYMRSKRDAGRERSLDDGLQRSSMRLQASIAIQQSSPSHRAQRHETAVRLADALANLPQAQREAIMLQKFDGCSVTEIAERMQRSPEAVAGLLKRGLEQLRSVMKEQE